MTMELMELFCQCKNYVQNLIFFGNVSSFIMKFKLENGTILLLSCRLAVNHNNFLTSAIGMKDTITKQKVVVRAMDVVLFGPPRGNKIINSINTVVTIMVVINLLLLYVYR